MTYDGHRLTFRQAAAFLLFQAGFAAYCGAWIAGFVWLLS